MIPPSPPFDEVSLFNITNILIEEYGIKMDVRSKFLHYLKYLNRPIGIKIENVKTNKFIWSKYRKHVVVWFMDMNIENVSSIYQNIKFGKNDGIYIPFEGRNIFDVAEDVNNAIEALKDYIDLE
jgi:hypothetical protein